jgi:hypothetical protein
MTRYYIASMLKNHKTTMFPLLVLLIGCVADDEFAFERVTAESLSEAMTDESLESIDDDVQLDYRKATASLDVALNVDKFAGAASASTIDCTIDVTTPDGMTTRHELSWTKSEDQEIPRFEIPVLDNGPYEVVLTGLAIDGQALEVPFTRQRLDVKADRDEAERSHRGHGRGRGHGHGHGHGGHGHGHHDDGGHDDDDDDGGHHDDDDDDDDDGGHHGGHDHGDDDDDDDGGHHGGHDHGDHDDGDWD